jgi:hypothetical protein
MLRLLAFSVLILQVTAQKNETVDTKAIAKPNPKGKQTFCFLSIENHMFLLYLV